MLGAFITSLLITTSVAPAQTHERWVGTHLVHGERKLPLVGQVTTRTTTWVLADVLRDDHRLQISERPCKVEFGKVAGAKVWLDPDSLSRMPLNTWNLGLDRHDELVSTFAFGWDASDVDEDGDPGATVYLRTPVCLGRMFVTSWTVGVANAQPTQTGLEGDIRMTLDQRVLGVGGLCVKAFIRSAVEKMAGKFVYTRVADDATCSTLTEDAWPAPPE